MFYSYFPNLFSEIASWVQILYPKAQNNRILKLGSSWCLQVEYNRLSFHYKWYNLIKNKVILATRMFKLFSRRVNQQSLESCSNFREASWELNLAGALPFALITPKESLVEEGVSFVKGSSMGKKEVGGSGDGEREKEGWSRTKDICVN